MRSFQAPLSALALLSLVPNVASASDWHPGAPSAAVRSATSPEQKALVYLAERGGELRTRDTELQIARVVRGRGSAATVRLEQHVQGVPVLGGAVLVRVGGDGEVSRVVVAVQRDLDVSPVPTIFADEATAMLSDALGRSAPTEASSLVITPAGGGALLWQLDVRDSAGGSRYFVDAHTGALSGYRNLATHALGRVYSDNAVETPSPIDAELLTLDVTPNPILLNGWGGLLSVTNYVSGGSMSAYVLEQTLQPSASPDFLYDPPALATDPADAFAQVSLFYHLTTMRSFFEALGVDQTAASWKLTAVANAKEDGAALDNAFFSPMGQTGAFASPNLIAIGQGATVDFSYDSDVFKHEFGHYVTENDVGYNLGQTYFDEYGINPFSGSIDEGISDYFACSSNDDPELGEASLEPNGGLRDLTLTSKRCPADILGEVHLDGEIIGSLSWSVREAVGSTAADQIIWGAVSSMPPGGTMGDFGRGIVATTQELVTNGDLVAADLGTVQGIIADRGLDECDQVLPLAPGETRITQIIGLDIIGQLLGGTCAQAKGFGVSMQSLFHFSATPAAGDSTLRFQVDAVPFGGSGAPELTIYARKGSHVTFAAGTFLPQVDEFDHVFVIPNDSGELVLDASSDPPFDPTAEYFFAVTSVSCPNVRITVQTSNTPIEGVGGGGVGGGGAGGGAGGGPVAEDEGCDCRASAGSSSPNAPVGALAALALLGAFRGRRSTRRAGRR